MHKKHNGTVEYYNIRRKAVYVHSKQKDYDVLLLRCSSRDLLYGRMLKYMNDRY